MRVVSLVPSLTEAVALTRPGGAGHRHRPVPVRPGWTSPGSAGASARTADVLTGAARAADLLVLGSHGNSRIRHTVLGSVSEECVRRANCPVVVVPVPASTTPTSTEPALRA